MDSILHLFYDLYREIDPEDLDEDADGEENDIFMMWDPDNRVGGVALIQVLEI